MQQKANTNSLIDNVRLYFKIKQYYSAEKLLNTALQNGIDNATIRFWLGKSLHLQQKLTAALAEFNRVIEAEPSHPEAMLCLIATYCDLGRYEDGWELQQNLLRNQNPSDKLDAIARQRLRDCHRSTADLYANLGKRIEAIQEYQRALSYDRNDHDTRMRLATTCYYPDNIPHAQDELAAVLADDPEHYEALLWSGLCYYKQNDPDMATEQWERAYRLLPLDNKVQALQQINM